MYCTVLYAQHPAICGQVTKKMHRVSAQNEASRFKQAAATFSLSMHQYGRSFFLSTGFFFRD
jgi:hypothetical protein